MVFGELLSRLWNMNKNDYTGVTDKNNHSLINEGIYLQESGNLSQGVDLPQGVQLLKYRANKIQRLEKQTNMLSESNGYSRNETFYGNQNNMRSMPDNVEGFTGMIGPTSANKLNEQELSELRNTEDTFNKNMSNYATAHQTLMDKARSFITSTDSSNKFANKNVRLANGEIGYVNSRGTYKWYPSQEIFNSTAGNNGCPSSYVSVDVESNNYNMPGSTINTNPKLNVGTFMTQGQSCGREGRNIYASQSANPRDLVPKWEGCYKTSSSDGMVFQKDLGDKVSVSTCKTRAADLGYSTFSLRDNGTGCSQCYIGNDINTAKAGGIATKAATSYSFVTSPDAVVSGLLRNGQIGVGKDIKQVSSMKTQFNAVPGCLPDIGAEINTNTLVGTYGANCKAPISIKCPIGYSGPNADNMCTAGWSSSCGEACAKSNCSAAGGSWIPLDYANNPYTCQMRVPNNLVKINVSKFVSWDDANKLAGDNGGRLPTKDEFKAATINVGNIDFWMPGTSGNKKNEWIHVGTDGWPLYYAHIENVGYPPPWGINNAPAGFRPGPSSPSTINYIYIVKDPTNTMPPAATSTPAVPTSTPAVPKSTPAVPTSTQAVPTSTQAVPTSTPAVPKSTPAVPTSTQAAVQEPEFNGNYLITTPDENMMVEFGDNKVVFYYTSSISNRVFWKFIPVPNEKNMYNIQSTWRCDTNDYRCGYYISYTGYNIIITPEKLQWEVIKTDKPDIFYIRNGCSEPNSRCQYYLGYSSTSIGTQLTLTSTPYPFKITPQIQWSSK